MSIPCHTMSNGPVKVCQAVFADASFLVGRDVRSENGSHWRCHFQAAGERRAAWRAVACDTIAKSGDVLAVSNERGRWCLNASNAIEGGGGSQSHESRYTGRYHEAAHQQRGQKFH